ncbi:hypothetical protein J3Q64DRAFT_1824715 [Phycomyces blakesleeanus]|uniref:NAD-dependent epimerase/dehydratase domain-containing protein n=2 Tax=Phycomyces blakesleeanus TaxID=4837 RepID=A0A162PPD7_PHYB8|nr:hypothetical protein PHYBLDRAFT_124111 [Phycomyces blakesleeanus NRRL 1555(-)]OAD74727.1 hypothetical protein PHYBLDRAFT_124111 [Phycomyces blakesleeanus NRRL 1555(-)]|eukprot:XP_018292767.1 hypothetical protein PHYBLDRAFT_124111 [Phycomyces blakesleeanus NRRL 1555(-)]
MAQPFARKLLVVGGSGFLGQSVCQMAVRKGWETISLSRRGEPISFSEKGRPEWAENVKWASGNSLEPNTFKDVLHGVTDVVHTVGILLESDYKAVIQAKTTCDAAKGVANVLAEVAGMKDDGNPLDPKNQQRAGSATYETMNRDTAISVAKEVMRLPSLDSFVYISASDVFPLVNPRYITTKREAESFLLSHRSIRSIVLRPGFMYSDQRPAAAFMATNLQLVNTITSPISKGLRSLPFGKVLTTPPLHINTVAAAVISSIENSETKGIFDVQSIQEMAVRY